ncbi:ATP-dependent endonuclease [Vibrio gallicus]|uniref:ATP-dependent endonuclease n=1 Tax=Vibrio gallicus TaxID=190897 RepID=UPI0021C2C965|nr:ATP-dependent endonuclease [Vibrio gallicus]
MQLERIEISGFRGIKRLSLAFDELTTLIGENTWGKSSLLDALSVSLPTNAEPYTFEMRDFHVDYAISHPQTQHLQIILKLRANTINEPRSGRYRKIKPIWNQDPNHKPFIIYRLSAAMQDGKISSEYAFLDEMGDPKPLHHSVKLAQELMGLHPVIRLRDSRRFQRVHTTQQPNSRIERRIKNTCRRLLAHPGLVSKQEMKSSFRTMHDLVDHYFSYKSQGRHDPSSPRDGIFSSSGIQQNHTNTSLSQFVDNAQDKQTRLLLMGLLNNYLQAKGDTELRRCARPLLIIEDPEGRLHPTHLARAWALLQMLPMQKILTTNSAVLLSAVPLGSIKRLIRKSDRTESRSISAQSLSADELRRVGFHIRFHRSSALFARCWLLVEGETEVWLFNELANQCGYDLAAEGVQIVEFAQSGLKSLLKVAKAFGIDWHVVTDGDAAGKKYAHSVRNVLHGEQERHRLTELPDKDIEHYLYFNGFETFFKDMAKIPLDHPIPAKKVINKVLKKHAKPDVALAIVEYCEKHGDTSVPLLIRWTLKRVISMANGNT